MPPPSATLVNLTSTGDVVTGPGMPTNLVNGLPQARMGDLVTGAVCTGAVTVTTAVNMLTKERHCTNLGSVVTGVNPLTGIPVATALAVCPNINKLV